MPNYVKPDIIQKFSGVKVDLWKWIEREIGNANGTFTLDQGELADEFEVSRTTIINALKTFCAANLMDKVASGRGRGNHSRYKMCWTFKKKSSEKCNPSRAKNEAQEKSITKGTKTYQYFAMKMREAVEDSSLESKSHIVVGKLLDFLEGKAKHLFKTYLTRLKRWLNGEPADKNLRDFFVFFHRGLKSIARSYRATAQTRQRIKEQKKRKEEVREEYQQNPPPRLKDCGSFAAYQKAMEEWKGDSEEVEESDQQVEDGNPIERHDSEPTLTDLLDEELTGSEAELGAC